jgi:hypothetical protein
VKDFFLVLSVVLTVISVIPYLRDIVRGKTKPNLVSWITWTLLTGIATAAAISAGEFVAAFLTGAATMATALIVIFGLNHGYVKFGRFDIVCQLSAIVGIILWQLFDSPAIAVVAAVVIDLIGGLPTVRHIWQKPFEETWQTFGIAALGAGATLLALETYNWVSLPYAIFILVANTVFMSLILYRRPLVGRAR